MKEIKTYGISRSIRKPVELQKIKETEAKGYIPKYKDVPVTRSDWKYKYHIRYGVIHPEKIINMCGPDSNYIPTNWLDPVQIQERINIKNKYINSFNRDINFYSNLEKSIIEQGILNPILVTVGVPRFQNQSSIPPEYRIDEQSMICEILGGSRLFIAQKHSIFVPCIITDFTNQFPYLPTLYSVEEISEYFYNKPETIYLTDDGIRMSPPEHIHLEPQNRSIATVSRLRRAIIKNEL